MIWSNLMIRFDDPYPGFDNTGLEGGCRGLLWLVHNHSSFKAFLRMAWTAQPGQETFNQFNNLHKPKTMKRKWI